MVEQLLSALAAAPIPDSFAFAQSLGVEHNVLVGTIKSLVADGYITESPFEVSSWELTEEAKSYLQAGSPEAQIFRFLQTSGPLSQDALNQALGPVGKVGFPHAMRLKWITVDKATKLVSAAAVDTVNDEVQQALQVFSSGEETKVNVDDLKKRKLIVLSKKTHFALAQGPKFRPTRTKLPATLTTDMLKNSQWRSIQFKEYNIDAKGAVLPRGALHPLLKVRAEFRKILLEMGFEEMPTNAYVESSFWNFDALFQPQQHPARDAHDTFFVREPKLIHNFPDDYAERVKAIHEQGGEGSIGYRYPWSLLEAEKAILRTHTTGVSAKMLYKLAQDGFQPKKYFSIDRVFRNEAVDATHLAEFFQIEGVVADRNMSLAYMIGMAQEFFRRVGITQLKFKPAYNPYTEPSMEIFGFHPILKAWKEIGNSGVFRPEMLRPMVRSTQGLPEDVSVLGWGFGLERPTMIQFGIDNIRDLCGQKQAVAVIQDSPICNFD
jgi:phenylalanyl-tRNA synthetase alpha chain